MEVFSRTTTASLKTKQSFESISDKLTKTMQSFYSNNKLLTKVKYNRQIITDIIYFSLFPT